MVLVNSDYHTRKYFSENYLQFGLDALKNVLQPCPRPKRLKEYRFNEEGLKSFASSVTFY